MDVPKVPPRSALTELAGLLDSPEIAALVFELEATRWTGRPGYPIRAMIGMALVKSLYAIPTWSRTAASSRSILPCKARSAVRRACTPVTASPQSSATRATS